MRNVADSISRRALMLSGVALSLFPRSPALAKPKPQFGNSGLDLSAVDPAIRPGDDFFGHVNGRWVARTVIPDDQPGVSSFTAMRAKIASRIDLILDRAVAAPSTSDERRIGDIQAALLNAEAAESLGFEPIRDDLQRIDTARTPDELAMAMAHVARTLPRDWTEVAAPSALVPISPLVYLDITNPTRSRAFLVQGGTLLPSRETYTSDVPAQAALRNAYGTMLSTLFRLAGRDAPEDRAARVIALERKLASAQRSRAELGDLSKRAAVWSPAELTSRLPGIDWPRFLEALGFGDVTEIGMADPDAIAAAVAALKDEPVVNWQDYLTSRVLISFAPFGPAAFVNAHFLFYGSALRGLRQMPPRRERMRPWLDLAMGPAIGNIYVRETVTPASVAALRAMIGELKAAMGRRLQAVDWMAPATKREAFAKLAAIRIETGGEARPRNYEALVTDRSDAWGNAVRAAQVDYTRQLGKIFRPVDRGEWEMLSYRADAQSNPILLKLTFAAGMMQPPLYDAAADPAVNYAALGFYVAHELSHVFDNQGSQFDAAGRLRNWWSSEDRTRYDVATIKLSAQVDSYQVLPGLHANGRQTSPENIADLGGVTLAHDAYRASLRGRPAPVIDGVTGDQRFFMAYAQLWRGKFRESYLRRQVAIDTHAPLTVRVATVRNIDAWYTAFDVKPGDRMYMAPTERVRIW